MLADDHEHARMLSHAGTNIQYPHELTRVCAFQHCRQLRVAHTGLLSSGAHRPRSDPDLREMNK